MVTRGVWGHALPGNFSILGFLKSCQGLIIMCSDVNQYVLIFYFNLVPGDTQVTKDLISFTYL